MPEVPSGAPTQDYRGTRLGVTPVYAPVLLAACVRSRQPLRVVSWRFGSHRRKPLRVVSLSFSAVSKEALA